MGGTPKAIRSGLSNVSLVGLKCTCDLDIPSDSRVGMIYTADQHTLYLFRTNGLRKNHLQSRGLAVEAQCCPILMIQTIKLPRIRNI